MTLVTAGVLYLALGFLLWAHAWAEGATTHTLCGCGDPALFLWFFQWPATALAARGKSVLLGGAVPSGRHQPAGADVGHRIEPAARAGDVDLGPGGVAQRGLDDHARAHGLYGVRGIRRWVTWTPAAFLGGLLYGFSPFVLTSLEFAHLMTAALWPFRSR